MQQKPIIEIKELRKSFGDNHVLAGFNMNLYKPSFTKIETAKRSPSTARKIDFLRSEGVPEPVILAYLIQLDIRQLRKPEGPRDTNDAIVRSARLLLRNRD